MTTQKRSWYDFVMGQPAGKKLRRWRDKQNLSQPVLAEQLEIAESTLSRLENGERQPGLDLAFRIQRRTNGVIPANRWGAHQDDKE